MATAPEAVKPRDAPSVAVLLMVVFLFRLVLLFSVQLDDPSRALAPDSLLYDQLARTLLATGRFEEEAVAHTRRTPGYPALIAATRWLAGDSLLPVLVLQVLASCGTILLTWWLARRLWSPRAGWLAALCLALDVPSLVSSQQLLTETFFTLALTCAAAAATVLMLEGRLVMSLSLGAAITVAALIRPIAVYAAGPALVWLAIAGHRLGWARRKVIAAIALLLLPWLIGVGGWTLRNGLHTGRYEFSGSVGRFLLLSRGADIVAQRDGVPPRDARETLLRSLEERSAAGEQPDPSETGWSLVRRHPWLFLRTQLRWLPALLLGTGVGGLYEYLGVSKGTPGASWSGQSLGEWIDRWGLGILMTFVAAALLLAVVYLAGARGLWSARHDGPAHVAAHAFLAGTVAYLVFLSTGPQTYSRFRVPVMPLLCLYAGRGLSLGLPARAARQSR